MHLLLPDQLCRQRLCFSPLPQGRNLQPRRAARHSRAFCFDLLLPVCVSARGYLWLQGGTGKRVSALSARSKITEVGSEAGERTLHAHSR